MKKYTNFVLLTIVCVLFFCGCNGDSERRYKVFTNREIEAGTGRVLVVVEESVKNKKIEPIYNEFSEYTKSKYDIKDDMGKFLNFIEGDIIEIRESYIGINRTAYYHDQGEVRLFYTGDINGIKTDTGKTYNILIEGTFHYRGREDIEGINYLYVYDEDVEPDEEGNRPGGGFEVGDVIK